MFEGVQHIHSLGNPIPMTCTSSRILILDHRWSYSCSPFIVWCFLFWGKQAVSHCHVWLLKGTHDGARSLKQWLKTMAGNMNQLASNLESNLVLFVFPLWSTHRCSPSKTDASDCLPRGMDDRLWSPKNSVTEDYWCNSVWMECAQDVLPCFVPDYHKNEPLN